MKNASFTEFRNHAREYFDEVEEGESFQIFRHGKPIAMLVPTSKVAATKLSTFKPLILKGFSISKMILTERKSEKRGRAS